MYRPKFVDSCPRDSKLLILLSKVIPHIDPAYHQPRDMTLVHQFLQEDPSLLFKRIPVFETKTWSINQVLRQISLWQCMLYCADMFFCEETTQYIKLVAGWPDLVQTQEHQVTTGCRDFIESNKDLRTYTLKDFTMEADRTSGQFRQERMACIFTGQISSPILMNDEGVLMFTMPEQAISELAPDTLAARFSLRPTKSYYFYVGGDGDYRTYEMTSHQKETELHLNRFKAFWVAEAKAIEEAEATEAAKPTEGKEEPGVALYDAASERSWGLI